MADEATTAPADTTEAWQQAMDRHQQDQPENAAPEPETEAHTEEAPSEETSAGTAETSDDTFTNFRLEDVPEEHREYVEKAYKQLQGDYTRKTQSLAEERKQAENAIAFINALQSEDQRQHALGQLVGYYGGEQALLDLLGIELLGDHDDTTDEPENDDPQERMLREWEEFKAYQAQQEAQAEAERARQAEEAQLAAIDKSVETQLETLTEKHGEISPEEQQFVVGHALANLPPDEAGMPQIVKAFEDLTGAWKAREKRWAQSKETTHVAPTGVAATQVPDLDDERTRRDWIAEQYQKLEESQLGN